jgi:hypothetical protein
MPIYVVDLYSALPAPSSLSVTRFLIKTHVGWVATWAHFLSFKKGLSKNYPSYV